MKNSDRISNKYYGIDNGIITVDRWVTHLEFYRIKPDRMLAKNTREMCTQLVYLENTTLSKDLNQLNNSIKNISEEIKHNLNDSFCIKIKYLDHNITT